MMMMMMLQIVAKTYAVISSSYLLRLFWLSSHSNFARFSVAA